MSQSKKSSTLKLSSYQRTEAWETPEELDWLNRLQFDEKSQHLELLHCREDPWYCITHWFFTADTSDEIDPIKLFPNKIHLYTILNYWIHYPLLAIPKSRQVSATWAFCAIFLWYSMFYPHRINFVQSKKEEDADELLKRINIIYTNLPLWMRHWCPAEKTYCLLSFGRNQSRIIAVPSGPHHIRSYQASALFNDETVFQVEVDQMLAAAKPTIKSGGRIALISSAGPSLFASIVADEI